MSYILDALRKSEAERRQGKAPDLGQPVQMVYRPPKKPVSTFAWIVLGLLLNAGILGYVFWPEIRARLVPTLIEVPHAQQEVIEEKESVVDSNPENPEVSPSVTPVEIQSAPDEPAETAITAEPTIIVPRPATRNQQELTPNRSQGRVPHLVELPLSFQKSIPDLTFNSHIVSSNSSASSVMINSQYLRAGDRMGELRVEQISEDGVVFSKDGQQFRVGTMRNWVSPR